MAKKRKSTPVRKPVTALARRPAPRQQIELVVNDPRQMLPAPAPAPTMGVIDITRELDDKVLIGGFGTVELTLSAAEEAVFAEPVSEADVLIKPTGQPYLSHPTYTRWFNRALGRGAWALVPVSKPRISGSTVVCEYMLHIHGRPIAFAIGEQEYHENNREQTYGDAYEATNASALRRCAKRLGIGLELWDKRWLQSFMDRMAVKVWKEGEKNPQFRRRDDPPFWWERDRGWTGEPVNTRTGEVRPAPQARQAPPIAHRHDGEEVISDIKRSSVPGSKVGQVQRLHVIAKKAGRDAESVKSWLAVAYGYTSSKQIKRKHYDAICAAIEAPGPLPAGPLQEEQNREPGEEG